MNKKELEYLSPKRNIDFENGAYIIDEDIIVPYDLCVTRQEHMDEYINSEKWTLIGYGYCVNTTLLNTVSSDKEISAFFVINY